MNIVDSQVHIWTKSRPDRPWPPGGEQRAHRPEAFTADDLLKEMDAAGVRAAVLVPPSWEGDYNDVCLEAAQSHPDRFAVMGRISLCDPRGPKRLQTWRQQPGMLGLRFTFHTESQRSWLLDGTADWMWSTAEKAEIPLMILPPASMLPNLQGIIKRHPDLKLAIDHLALSRQKRGEEGFSHLSALMSLAKFENVSVKASALPDYSLEDFPYPALHKHIRSIYEAFGPKRMFWGSDLSRLSCSYSQVIRLFTEELHWLPPNDKEYIMGRGLCEWLNWPILNHEADPN
jgi:L-fuconolactonase